MTQSRQSFDRFARGYVQALDEAVSVSGYAGDHFVEIKVRICASIADAATTREVLDFGCGIGSTTRALARAFPGARVTGVDVSTESLTVAEELSAAEPAGEVYRFIDSGLPFADGAFDLVFTANVFHHVEREEQAFWARELFRILRPGGSLMLFEHNPLNPLTRWVVKTCPFDEGVTLLRSGYAARLLRSAGFDAERPRFYFFFPRVLDALQPLEPRLAWLPLGAQYYVIGRVPG